MRFILSIIMVVVLIIIIIVIKKKRWNVMENYESPNLNFHNGIFLVRPPYEIAKLYTPYKNIMPTFQYEYNEIAMPTPE